MFPTPEETLTLENIDFDWVEKCTSVKRLKQALQILVDDGNHFSDLENAIKKRIDSLNPAASKTLKKQNIDPEHKKQVQQDLQEWENEMKERENKKKNIEERRNIGGMFSSSDAPQEEMDEERRKSLAENEKVKGNEAIGGGEIKEALRHYTKSIQYYDKIAATFCNRALAYLKLKDYKSCVNDCDKALNLQPDYSKAFHRKAKANFALGNFRQAVEDFQKVMALEPNNKEVNNELMEARKKLSETGGSASQNGSSTTAPKQAEFKRVTIQEDSESDEEEQTQPQNGQVKGNAKESEGTDKFDQLVGDMLLEEQKKNLGSKIAKVDGFKAKANDLLKTGMYELAIAEYEKGLKVIIDIQTSRVPVDASYNLPDLKAVLFNNIAYCYMQMDLSSDVIKTASRVIEIDGAQKNTLIKAHLRRALAYEKIDKIVPALRDFEVVKSMDPGNVQASEGLHRLHKIIHKDEDLKLSLEKSRSQELKTKTETKKEGDDKEEIKHTQSLPNKSELEAKAEKGAKPSVGIDHDKLEGLKLQGNNYFKEKKYKDANNSFNEAKAKIEEHLKEQISREDKSKLQKLYVQILSNAAMCCFNLEDIGESLKNCQKALEIEPTHQKCLYRKALCQIKIGERVGNEKEDVENKKKSLLFYEQAQKILESILKLDNTSGDAKTKLEEVIRTQIQIKKRYGIPDKKPEKIEVQAESNANEEEGKGEDTPSNQTKAKSKGPSHTLSNTYIEDVVKTVTNNLLAGDDLPQTTNKFEINCQSFKKDVNSLYLYLKKLPVEHLVKLYKEKTIPTDLMMTLINSVKIAGLKNDPEHSFRLMEALPQTYKFHIAISQTMKKEKQEIQSVLSELQKGLGSKGAEIDALYDKYKCRV